MGWMYTDRTGTIEEYFERKFDLTKYRLIGKGAVVNFREYYRCLEEIDTGERLIFVCLLDLHGDGSFNFGYKDMCDSMGPCVYNCPERILKEAEKSTVPCKGWARKWRDECWKVIEKRKKAKNLKDGDIIKFPQTLEFISGFRGDTFVFRKSGRQIYFESVGDGHLVRITNWRTRDWELLSA